jgi:valyl-tRNA synthetase
MSAAAGAYAGLDRFEARKRIVQDLEAQGFLERVTDHKHAVGVCDRCKTVVEPRVSEQWFLKMKDLAAEAVTAVEQGLISVVPENQRTIYLNWMANIRDWCISRQLWWGHRIPIWHCADCQAMTPARDSRVEVIDGHARGASPPEKCAACGSSKLKQDNDVLDTWFSSGLWPFSTMGWPDDTEDLRTFYPTSVLISGYDILFFWDARMIMMGLHLMKDRRPEMADRVPFRELYLHALVRDPEGVKMSKTRGNVVDPLELIEKYGTDALRFTLTVMAAPGTDIALSEDRILSYRAFANKIWNAARFIFVNLEKFQAASGASIEELAAPDVRDAAPYATAGQVALADRWIYSRLAQTVATVNDALEHFRFHEAAHVVYHFFWGDFCDWYIEWIKPALTADADREAALAAWRNLFAIFDAALRLLHPTMPFLTEELWHRLPQRAEARSIALEHFPDPSDTWRDAEAEEQVALLQELITAARNIRAEKKIDPKRRVAADVYSATGTAAILIESNRRFVEQGAALSELRLSSQPLDSGGNTMRTVGPYDFRLDDVIDVAAELARLAKEKDRLERDIESKRTRLSDETFRSKAPAKIVQQMEATLTERNTELDKVNERLTQLEKTSAKT